MAEGGLGYMYKRVLLPITKKVEDRQKYELLALEDWFRKKSKVLKDVRMGELHCLYCLPVFMNPESCMEIFHCPRQL